MIEWHPDMKVDTEQRGHQEGPGRRPRVPAHQPPARLPGVRQGRRVPAAGPDHRLRPGREPLRRGEAALREADPDQRPRAPRPRALHPLRPLHPVRQGGGRRPADPLHRPGQRRPQVNTFPDHPFASYFSGNTVQICPVGALTATPYRFKARPWDLDQAESTCTTCSVGCRVAVAVLPQRGPALPAASTSTRSTGAGSATRAASASRHVNSADRLGEPLVRTPGGSGLDHGPLVRGPAAGPPRPSRPPPADRIGVIGGARLTNESRLRLGQAGQGRARHRQRRRPARRRPARRGRARPAPGHHRRGLRPGRHRAPARPRPQGGAAASSSCACATPSVEDGVTVVELAPSATSLAALAAAPPAPSPAPPARRAALGRPCAVGGVDAGLARGDAARRSGHRRPRPAVAGRVRRPHGRAPPPALADARARRPLPLARCAAATSTAPSTWAWPPACCPAGSRSTAAARPSPTSGRRSRPSAGLDTDAASSQAAADGGIDVLVLLGADPLPGLPRPRPGPPGLAGGPHGDRRRPVPHRLGRGRPTSCCPPPASPRSTAPPPTSRAGSAPSTQKVTRPGTARADWMIAAELARRLGADLGLESVEDICAEIERAGPDATPGSCGVDADGSVRSPRRRERRRR